MILHENERPYYGDYQNAAESAVSPVNINLTNNQLSRYYARYLLQKAMSVFKWNIPDEWPLNYILYSVYTWGYIGIVNTDRFGVIPMICGLGGYNVFYQPKYAIFANPLLKESFRADIDVKCTLLRLQPDYCGIMDIIYHYAGLMALTTESMISNLYNSKVAYVFASESTKNAQEFKLMYDKIASGNPAVFVGKKLFREDGTPQWQLFDTNVSKSYIVDKLLVDLGKISTKFCAEIGIPNANTDKRERLLTSEVASNNFETKAKAQLWLESLQTGCDKTNRMFGTDISVDWREDLKQITQPTADQDPGEEVREDNDN